MKLDLHTHCHEATFTQYSMTEAAREIVAVIKAKGLDGIAITDHLESRWARRVTGIVNGLCPNDVLIIPGQEVERGQLHIVELFVSDDAIFRFIAHPPEGSPWEKYIGDDIHGVEIANPHWNLDREKIERLAAEHDLLTLANSDAHSLDAIGLNFNVVELEELVWRAKRVCPR